jgi:Tol biopolymer transport system component
MSIPLFRPIAWLTLVSLLFILSTRLLGTVLPNQGQIAFASDRDEDLDIYLLDITRQIAINLTHNTASDYQPAWSPDGLALAYVSDRPGNREIYTQRVGCPSLFSACPAAPRRITHNPTIDFDPAWSPDGDFILYSREWFNSTEVVLSSVDGGTFHFLTQNDFLDANPAWSPDGTQILFVSDRDSRFNVDLYVMDTSCLNFPESCGTKARRLLDEPDNQFAPIWSPDASRVVFTTTGNPFRQMAVLDLASPHTIIPLLDSLGGDDTPSWSPDGLSIVFQSYREDQVADLYILRLDCADSCLRRITHDRAFDVGPRWRP